MKPDIAFFIPGQPKPQQRHRDKKPITKNGRTFTPKYDPSNKYKKEFLRKAIKYKPKKPFDEPIRVDIVFYMQRPKSHYRTGKNSHLLKKDYPKFYTNKPDLDNLVKFVKDSLNKVFWKDDSVITMGWYHKVYSNDPGTEIEISTLTL